MHTWSSDNVANGNTSVTLKKKKHFLSRWNENIIVRLQIHASRSAGLEDLESSQSNVRALDAEAAVTKLDGKSADEGEEEHDQSPLASWRLHEEALRHQREIEDHADSDGRRQQEADDADSLSFIL